MIQTFKNNRPNRTSLTWEEQNPKIYVYQELVEIQSLQEETDRLKEKIKSFKT